MERKSPEKVYHYPATSNVNGSTGREEGCMGQNVLTPKAA